MTIVEYDRIRFKTTGSEKTVTILNDAGSLWIPPQWNKENISSTITHMIYPKYAEKKKLTKVKEKGTLAYIWNPRLVVYVSSSLVKRAMLNFRRIINELEEKMGIGRSIVLIPDCGKTVNVHPMVSICPYFWIKSPIALSAYFIFMRLAHLMDDSDSFNHAINRFCEKSNATGNHNDKRNMGYINKTVKNGNLHGLINRSLPCLSRENLSDYLLNSQDRGFADYNLGEDLKYPTTELDLMRMQCAIDNGK